MIKNKITCNNCGIEVSVNNFAKHVNSKACETVKNKCNAKKIYVDEAWKTTDGKYSCPYCNREYSKNGICTHIWRTHGDGKNFTSCNDGYANGTRSGTNAFIKGTKIGHSPETKEKLKKISTGRRHTDETKHILSISATKNELGGVRQSKQILYKNKKLGSTYELLLVQDLEENNIQWDTCKRIKYHSPDGKERTYTPDIYLPEFDIYLDPKNDYLISNINPSLGFRDVDKIKWVCEQNHIRVFILNKRQLNWKYVKTLI